MNPGDLVQLKSGGPTMTVNFVGSEVVCVWFDPGSMQFKTLQTSADALEPASPNISGKIEMPDQGVA